jgi:small subunit ribosomal protein S1
MSEETTVTAPSPLAPVTYPEGAKSAQTMQDLISSGIEIKVLKAGDMVEGTLISAGKNEVYVDLEGYGIGVVRGRELYDDQASIASLVPGDKLLVSVVETENKEGVVELSLRQAGQSKVWQTLKEKMENKEIMRVKILEANKGGLMIELNNVMGFLPVSQLSIEHYPRVEDGDKSKILGILRSYVGQMFDVQVITADPEEEKLIVSEKAVMEKEMEGRLSKLKIGDIVEGTVTGVVDFGAFVKFGELEGLKFRGTEITLIDAFTRRNAESKTIFGDFPLSCEQFPSERDT